jgi:DNA polymerase-3 subunit chi
MGDVYFYHLTRSAQDVALARLLQSALGRGWRVVVRGTDRGRLEWLDERLWLSPEDGFLPHGLEGGPYDADQPVLLTDSHTLPDGVVCLMAIEGAAVTAEEAAGVQRVCILFDGADAAAVDLARGQWRALTGAGLGAQYWAEQGGRWEKKQERPAAGRAD